MPGCVSAYWGAATAYETNATRSSGAGPSGNKHRNESTGQRPAIRHFVNSRKRQQGATVTSNSASTARLHSSWAPRFTGPPVSKSTEYNYLAFSPTRKPAIKHHTNCPTGRHPAIRDYVHSPTRQQNATATPNSVSTGGWLFLGTVLRDVSGLKQKAARARPGQPTATTHHENACAEHRPPIGDNLNSAHKRTRRHRHLEFRVDRTIVCVSGMML